MPMSYDAFMAERTDDLAIPFEAFGRTFKILSPELLSDEDAAELLSIMEKENPAPGDIARMAHLMLDDFPAFSAAGGTALGLVAFMEEVKAERDAKSKDEQGVTEGESVAS